jgi:anti-sigma factor RsiW
MTCSPFDLKDFLFGELTDEEKDSVERHLLACTACQDELTGLNATRTAVLCMREEEPPRRIAFVSDKVFEPRWWQRIFAPGSKLGFASAALLAFAIVFHAAYEPARTQSPAAVVQIDQKMLEAEVLERVQSAVNQAVVETEARQTERLLQVVNDRLARSDRRYEMGLQTIQHYLEVTQKTNALEYKRINYEPSGVVQ